MMGGLIIRKIKKILVDSASPETCTAILLSMKKNKPISKNELFKKLKDFRGIKVDSTLFRPLNRLKDLGIIEELNKDNFTLTILGNNCKTLLIEDKNLFYDFMHHIHIRSAFDDTKDGYFLTYFLITKYIYEKRNVDNRDKLLSNVLSDIELELGRDNVKSIDTSSISKVMSWIKVLKPPFITERNNSFIPRKDVPLKVILLAISAYYEKMKLPYGTPIMLDEKSIKEISLMGLIDPIFLISNLSILPSLYPKISLNDTVDGKAILLRKKIDIEELL